MKKVPEKSKFNKQNKKNDHKESDKNQNKYIGESKSSELLSESETDSSEKTYLTGSEMESQSSSNDSSSESNLNAESNDTSDSDNETSDSDETNSSNESSDDEEDFQYEVFQNDYLILYKLGSGAFSTVWLTYQISKDDFFALKIQNHDCYREGVLEKNCLEVCSSFPTNTLIKMYESFEIVQDNKTYLCMVLELAIDSAYYFLKAYKSNNKGFPALVMKKMHENVLEGLSYLHGNELIHTDIKPENILVCGKDKRLKVLKEKIESIKFKKVVEDEISRYREKFDMKNKKQKDKFRKGKRNILLQIVDQLAKILKIEDIYEDLDNLIYTDEEMLEFTFKIADLGTIHSYRQMVDDHRFPCIQTRYYRAPDVILKIPYDYRVDYWSLACMYYELVEGKLLFDPHHIGNITTDMVHLYEIIQWLGKPPKEKLKESVMKKYFDKESNLRFEIVNKEEHKKKEINQEKWDSDVLSFFYRLMSWL